MCYFVEPLVEHLVSLAQAGFRISVRFLTLSELAMMRMQDTQHHAINKRINKYVQALPPDAYRGTRDKDNRYMYNHTIRANFIELANGHILSSEAFGQLLASVHGVRNAVENKRNVFLIFSKLFLNSKGFRFKLCEPNMPWKHGEFYGKLRAAWE